MFFNYVNYFIYSFKKHQLFYLLNEMRKLYNLIIFVLWSL